jgi:hypothetical protein
MSEVAKSKELNVPKELLQVVPEGTPVIEISRSIGFTVNLQGYESARIDSTVKITGALENKDTIAKAVEEELADQITAQIQDIVKQHDPHKTLLGYKK